MYTFYRVSNIETNQGLWYDIMGEFTGLIHTDFKFCTNNDLRMPFDDEIVGYLSAVRSLEELYKWFSLDDIKKLQLSGFFIHEYLVEDFKFYEKFQHHAINQETSILTKRIILL